MQSEIGDLPDVDEVIGESGEQFGSIGVPGEGESGVSLTSLGHLLFLGQGQIGIRLVFIGHQIPDLDSVLGGHTDPLEFGVEKDLVDFTLGVNRTDGFLEVGHIPEIEDFVLTSGGQVLGVGGNGNSVDLTVMGLESVSDLEIGVPDLELSVPSD
jgi:hypothetical protein